MSNVVDVPKGKVSCLLCRGFVSYKDNDKARFKDHMLNEHDVKFDSDVILSVSVMTQKEKDFIVKSSLQRLIDIGNNLLPRSGETLLLAANPIPRSTNPTPPTPTQGGSNSGRIPQQQMQRLQRPSVSGAQQLKHQMPKVVPAPVPQLANINVSITKVDQSVKCDQCNLTLDNSKLLTEHMKATHLARFAGLQISTPSDNTSKRQSLPPAETRINSSSVKQEHRYSPAVPQDQVPSKRPRVIDATPANLKRLSMPNIPSKTSMFVSNNSPLQNKIPRISTPTQVPKGISLNPSSPRSNFGSNPKQKVPGALQSSPIVNRVGIVRPTPEEPKPDPAIKCNDCGKFVKQSIFKTHKQSHVQDSEGVPSQTSEVINKKKVKLQKTNKREEKLIDFVDMTDSDDEEIESKLEKTKPSDRNIVCPSCDKMLSSNMSLKMHMNLKHPVKSETVDDSEELLVEDEVSNDETNDKIRNEVENMETLELLDNLVNFLNES